MGGELYFPNNMSKESRSYLEQVVREKTGIIDTVTANIVCGVKASNDDETYSYRYVNESLPRMLGYTMEEFLEASGGSAGGLVYEEDKDRAFADCARCFAEGDTYISEYRVRKKDGSLIWVYDSGRKALDEDGSIRINSVLMDITSRKEAEEALAVEQERFRIALRSLVDTMFEYDIEHDTLTKYLRGEGSSEEMPAEETIDRYLERLETGQYVHLDDIGAMKDALLHGTDSGVDVRQRSREDAEWLWTRMTCSIYEDINGKATRTIGCWRDVDEERRTHDHLVREAQRDPLTQLFNLRTAAEMIDAHLGACRAEGLGALLLLDIDDFKGINDSYGHLAGNVVLAALAQDLDRLFSRKGVVARLGGDEFLVFLPQATEQDAVKAADEILGLSAANASRDYPASISVGIGLVSRSLGKAARAGAAQDGGAAADQASTCSLYRSILDGDAASAALSRLLESADSALYRAKRAGKGRASL